jgi:hypothetical protein
MSDLVSRLRDYGVLCYRERIFDLGKLLLAAADRIEQLERQNSDLQANNTKLVLEMRNIRAANTELRLRTKKKGIYLDT